MSKKKAIATGERIANVNLVNAVDWSSYIVRSDLGAILPFATREQFADHLNHFLISQRTGNYQEIETMSYVDWTALVGAYTDGKSGKVDTKKILDWFKESLSDEVGKVAEALEARRNFDKNMASAIHSVYDAAGTDIIPRPKVIMYALQNLKVPISQYDDAKDKMETYLSSGSANNETFGSILGPSGGMIRCKDEDGKPTATFSSNKAPVHFAPVIRAKKKK